MLRLATLFLFLAPFCNTAVSRCGGLFNGTDGEVSSPNYPNDYPNLRLCFFYIVTEPGTIIQLTFDDFELESSRSCNADYLEIYDGISSRNTPKLGRFCGYGFPPEITSSKNGLTLIFMADNEDQYSGFHATYTAIRPTQSQNVSAELI